MVAKHRGFGFGSVHRNNTSDFIPSPLLLYSHLPLSQVLQNGTSLLKGGGHGLG